MAGRTEGALEKLVIEAYGRGMGGNTIARQVGVGVSTVYNILRRHGIKRRSGARPRMFSPDAEKMIAERYGTGELPSEIASDMGCSTLTVRTIADRYGVRVRKRGGLPKRWLPEQRADIVASYAAGTSQDDIARRYGTSQATISRLLRESGVVTGRTGEAHHNWNGGRTAIGQYTAVRVDRDSPYASMRTNTGYVLEHRLVMAQQLGRPLERHETVHHINGDKRDNRPENLQVRQGRHGKGEVLVCSDCGSHNIVHAALS